MAGQIGGNPEKLLRSHNAHQPRQHSTRPQHFWRNDRRYRCDSSRGAVTFDIIPSEIEDGIVIKCNVHMKVFRRDKKYLFLTEEKNEH